MKTLDEVIAELEFEMTYNNGEMKPIDADALHYLKEYKNTDENYKKSIAHVTEVIDHYEKMVADYLSVNNPPLTWQELRQMEEKPVWVEECNGDTKGWLLILRTNYDVINCTTKHGNSFYLYKSSYGEKWKAYRKERTDAH